MHQKQFLCSAKSGIGIPDILEAIVNKVPAPPDKSDEPTRALIFDSRFDAYKGAIAYVRVKEGTIKAKDTIRMMHDNKDFDVTELGIFTPNLVPVQELPCGSVGCIAASIKNVADCHVGDTVTLANNPAPEPLPGYPQGCIYGILWSLSDRV